ncbi:MAG: hypothetical protein OEV15_06365 [Gallionella sp.]|nr:hypothetical protein [Gallionella sp.]
MSNNTLQHTRLNSIVDYVTALDTLCKLARHNLYMFDNSYDSAGFNTEARYTTLRNFLLANPVNRLFVLAHDMHYLSTFCPRMMMLFHQFSASMFICQTPKNMLHITEAFSVADDAHYVRRFHFDDTRGIQGMNDPENARALKSRFLEMWAASRPSVSTTKLSL